MIFDCSAWSLPFHIVFSRKDSNNIAVASISMCSKFFGCWRNAGIAYRITLPIHDNIGEYAIVSVINDEFIAIPLYGAMCKKRKNGHCAAKPGQLSGSSPGIHKRDCV